MCFLFVMFICILYFYNFIEVCIMYLNVVFLMLEIFLIIIVVFLFVLIMKCLLYIIELGVVVNNLILILLIFY